jgi:hypothetical protein
LALAHYHESVKTTVDLSDALAAAARKYAAEKGLTLKALIEAGLRRVLEDASGHKPFKLRKASVGGQGPMPGMDWPRMREEIYCGRGG